MDCFFCSLSPGYVGCQAENLTLNAKFFSFLLSDLSCLDKAQHVFFPQRIQKPDFFEEIKLLETKEFRDRFDQITLKIKKSYMNIQENATMFS